MAILVAGFPFCKLELGSVDTASIVALQAPHFTDLMGLTIDQPDLTSEMLVALDVALKPMHALTQLFFFLLEKMLVCSLAWCGRYLGC